MRGLTVAALALALLSLGVGVAAQPTGDAAEEVQDKAEEAPKEPAEVPEEPAEAPKEPLDVCVEAFGAVQTQRDAGKLLEARSHALTCGQPPCPATIAGKCREWLTLLDSVIPSIVIAAKDVAGGDTADVSVSIDGEVLLERLDGRPLSLNPGPHQLKLRHADRTIEHRVVLNEGDQGRRVEISFAPPKPPPSPDPVLVPEPVIDIEDGRGQQTAGWVIVGVGVASAAAGGILGIIALQQRSDSDALCSESTCPDTDDGNEAVHLYEVSGRNAQIADGLLFGGIGLAGVGLVVLLTSPGVLSASIGPGRFVLRGRF